MTSQTISALGNAIINLINRKTPIATADTAGMVKPDGNTISIDDNGVISSNGGGSSLPIGSTVVLDKVLSFEESQGLALQGTYVYKTAVAGERYGYPDFYNEYVNYKNNATATQTTLGSSTITIYNNANGLKFYNIADKGVIDTFFNSTGVADFYGIDEANERIFLPRNNKFWQFTTNTGEVNNYVEAGLPNITGGGALRLDNYGLFNNNSGVFKRGSDNRPPLAATTGAGWSNELYIDASRSNPIYGKSNTVQPPSSKKLLYYVVGNTVSDTSWVDVVTQVQGGVKDLEDKTQEGIERLKASSNALTTTQITNCITEIPQDIKLELNDGVLTLKAGSKVYVPNGFEADGTTPKFDEVVIENDITFTFGTGNGTWFLSIDNLGTVQRGYYAQNQIHSGSTKPNDTTNKYQIWYDTSSNIIKVSYDTGATFGNSLALLLGVVTVSAGVVTSIDQIFNGFGYIGSTVFALPGVKGLIPNGRNADGSLNNIEAVTKEVTIRTSTNAYDFDLALYSNGLVNTTNIINSRNDEQNNYYYTGSTKLKSMSMGTGSFTTSGVSLFNPKQPFRAVDYSDKATVSGWGMPSNKYINLTLGASGSTYIAPANGFVQLSANKATQVDLLNISTGVRNGYGVQTENTYRFTFIPVKRGDTFSAWHAITTLDYFRFIYAEGEV